jgi:uncharacterized membrane protein YphA (DoxX/SURF4 family)
MGIFFKARGTNSAGLLILRIIVGSYTLALGIMQASNIEAYINKVKAVNMLNENLAFIFGFILPFIMIVFGSLYIIGFFTPLTSLILAAITIAKIVLRGFFPSVGVPFNKDLVFFACYLTTLFSGAGVISFDALLDKKKKKVKINEPQTNTATVEIIQEPVVTTPPPSETTPQ